MARRRADIYSVHRGLLWGVAVGLALGLTLLLAPSALASQVSVIGTVDAVASDGSGGYYAGGSFTVPSSTIVNAVHINANGTLDASWNPNPDGTVKAIAVSGSKIYVGGAFSTVGGTARNNAAAVNASGTLDGSWNPNLNGTVNAIAVGSSAVYLGGTFSTINGGTGRNDAAAVDTNAGNDTGWNPSPMGTVNAIAVSGSSVYLGGSFTTPMNHAARVTNGTVDTGWNPNPNDVVNTLAVSGSTVYLGGNFTRVTGGVVVRNGKPRNTISSIGRVFAAAVNTGSGAANAWNPSPDGQVDAIAVSASTVYLGGSFNTITGAAGGGARANRHNAAGVDLFNGFDSGWSHDLNGTVFGVAVWGSNVYLGGQFTLADGSAQAGIDQLTGVRLAVQRAGSGSGTVTSNVAAINCGVSCSQVYDVGTSVTLTATPASGSTFSGWSGAGCSGTGTCKSIVTSDESVTATFTHGSSGAPGSPGSPGSPGTRTPKCTLKALSTSILLTAPKKRKHGKLVRPKFAPGALPIVVRCDQGARVTLTATVTEPIGKKPKRGKQRTKTIRLGPARISVRGNTGQTITLQLPHGLLADLKHHAKMSVALTLAATGSRGTGHVTGRIAALTGI